MSHARQGTYLCKQERYWNIDKEQIFDRTKSLIKKISGREEIEIPSEYFEEYYTVNKETDKKEIGIIYQGLIKNYDNHNFVFIKDYGYFNEDGNATMPLKMLYKRIVEIEKEVEANLNFEAILRGNKYIMQFAIIELWERVCIPYNISINSLWSLQETQLERDLFGAIMGIEESNAKIWGIELLIHYMNFKGRFDEKRS